MASKRHKRYNRNPVSRLEPLEANGSNDERSWVAHPRTVRAVWALMGRSLKLII
jgi:hypothetical protein